VKKRVFLIACAGRSGSTLLQRLLMSHKDLFMWGEGDHLLGHLLAAQAIYQPGYALDHQMHAAEEHWRNLHEKGVAEGWYPLLLPIRDAKHAYLQIRSWIDELMTNPYDASKSWGCKFVLMEPHRIKQLHSLFPDAGFIFLERTWHQVWRSM
jgi:hypothetical protein